jgi:SAM-dependent methyltransferase
MMSDISNNHPKQNAKTKQYWDSFYSDLPSNAPKHVVSVDGDGSFEWIVANSKQLLCEISDMFPAPSRGTNEKMQLKILEIGCGVSELSCFLLKSMLEQRSTCYDNELPSFEFVATDISEVCIEQNRERDQDFMAQLCNPDILKYEVLDILTTKPTQQYDVILDKGTLDTFLFRSKRSKKGTELYPPLLLPLLNNIHGWLKPSGKYIIISPRGRIKAVRDYAGFSNVRRVKFDARGLGDFVLMESNAPGNNGDRSKKEIYIYECSRNDAYNPEQDQPFRRVETIANDESTCPYCRQSFKEFRGKVKIEDQGRIVWGRKWNNHLVHCKK